MKFPKIKINLKLNWKDPKTLALIAAALAVAGVKPEVVETALKVIGPLLALL